VKVLLWPGAAGGRDHHTLRAIEERLAPVPVERIDFPYRREGRKAPDRAPKLIAHIGEEAARAGGDGSASRSATEALVLGGRSMGGRMCSMAVAEGLPAAGLVLLSYPLHPPGKPDKLRVEHLPQLEVPVLFVSGTKDPFGSPAELEAAAKAIPGPVTFCWLDGEGHDPKPRADVAICDAVERWLATV